MERARLAVGTFGRAPRHVEDPEAVEEVAAGQVDLTAQVQVERRLAFLGAEPEAALLAREIRCERGDRDVLGHPAHRAADDQPVANHRQRPIRPEPDHRPDGIGQLLQRRHGPAAHRGQGLGQAGRLDQVGGGHVHVLLPEDPPDAGHPGHRQRLLARPEVLVPAG